MKKLSFLVILIVIRYVSNCKLIKLNLYISFFLILNINFITKAQNTEIELDGMAENKNILSLKNQGLVIFYTSNNSDNTTKTWNFIKLDTNITQLWQTKINASTGFQYSNYCQIDQKLYLLFLKSYAFEIITIDLISGENTILNGITSHKQVLVEDFKIIGDLAIWGGCIPPTDGKVALKTGMAMLFFPLLFVPNFIPDKSAFAMSVSLSNGRKKDYSFNFKGFSSVTDIMSDAKTNDGFLFVKNSNGSQTNLFVQDISESGARSKSIKLSPVSAKYSLINGKLGYINNSKKVIIGTYKTSKNNGAQGFYFTVIENGKQDFIQYHSFSKLSNFFNYLGEKEQKRMTEKIASKKESGKDVSLNYNIILHDILAENGTFKIVGEAYYPHYRTDFRTIWINGRPVQQMFDVFDGWRYSHAIIASFDANGSLLWNDWLPIFNNSSYSLEEKVLAFESNTFVHLLFNNNGSIVSKTIDPNHPTQTIKYDNADSENENFELDTQYKIIHWYNNNLLMAQFSGTKSFFENSKNTSKVLISKYNILNMK